MVRLLREEPTTSSHHQSGNMNYKKGGRPSQSLQKERGKKKKGPLICERESASAKGEWELFVFRERGRLLSLYLLRGESGGVGGRKGEAKLSEGGQAWYTKQGSP